MLLHDVLVFTFTYGKSNYNDRHDKIEEKEEEEEAKEFELFRQQVLQQKKLAEEAETACKKQQQY